MRIIRTTLAFGLFLGFILPSIYTYSEAMDDYVWVTRYNNSNVMRITKSNLSTTFISAGTNPHGIAVDDTYVWVTNQGSSNVTRITKSDLSTTNITVGASPWGIAVDNTYVWAANSDNNNVTRIAKSGLTTTNISVGTSPRGVAVDNTYVWVANGGSSNVTRITKSDSSTTNISVGSSPRCVAVDSTYVWVTRDYTTVTRITKSDSSIANITIGDNAWGIAVDSTYVWAANGDAVTVTRITKSDSSTANINVGGTPRGVAVDNTYVWATRNNDNGATRITISSSATTVLFSAAGSTNPGDATGYNYDLWGWGVSMSYLVITGSATQNAGSPQTITITAKGTDDGTFTGYTGAKSIIFSGASDAPDGTHPTVDSVNFNTATTITFASGVATATMRLYKAETTHIDCTDGDGYTTTGNLSYGLDVTVNPGLLNNYTVSATSPQTQYTGWSEEIIGRDAYNNLVANDSSSVATMTNTGSAKFYTSNSYATQTTTYALSSGTADIYVKDYTAETITITAATGSATGTSSSVVINSASASPAISSTANQIFSVESSPAAISTITVTDNSSTPVINITGDIRIKIPSTLNMTWDTNDTTASIGGTASSKVSSTVSYEDSGKTLLIDVTSDFSAGDTLTVSGLNFANFSAASSADNLELVVTGSGGATAATDDKTITIAVAVPTISSANNQQFAVGDSATAISTITITEDSSKNSINTTQDIRVRIPSTFNMTWDAADTSADIGGTASGKVSSTVSYEDSNKTLVVDVTTNFSAGENITISGLGFTNFTAASSADNLELEVDNAGTIAAYDDKTVTIVGQGISTPGNGATVGRRPTITGTADANSSVTIKDESGNTVATATADSNGNFRVECDTLSVGSHTLTPYYSPTHGSPVTITVVESPITSQVPTITNPDDHSTIRSNKPTIEGKAALNSAVTITGLDSNNNLTTMGSGTSDSNGDYSITCSTEFPSGDNTISVTVNSVTSDILDVRFWDPYGKVYDSVTGQAIQGAEVYLYNASTKQLCTPGVEVLSSDTNPYITKEDGLYTFNTQNGTYYLVVEADGYKFPSDVIPMGSPNTGSHGEEFSVTIGAFEINIPLDADITLLKVIKEANKREINIGGIVTYTVTIKNESNTDVLSVYLDDKIPPGFKYLKGTSVDGDNDVLMDDPTGNRPITYNIGTMKANTEKNLSYQLVAGSGVTFGEYRNTAHCRYPNGRIISNDARKKVKVVPDVLFDLGTILGKVFDDKNGNGIQDRDEAGVPDIRIATEEGTLVYTDTYGRFHIPGIVPGTHLLRIDETTLPIGSTLTTEKVRIIRITNGLLAKVSFGVKLPPGTEFAPAEGEARITTQIIQEQTIINPQLGIGMYPEELGIRENNLITTPVFKITSNYIPFIKSWTLTIYKPRSRKPFKVIQGDVSNINEPIKWDGKDVDGKLVEFGKRYVYCLEVCDSTGKIDRTIEKVFRVKKVWTKEPEKKPEEQRIKEWIIEKQGINDLAAQTISVRGNRIIVKGTAEPDTKCTLKHIPIDSTQIPIPETDLIVDEDGKFQKEIILPYGKHKLDIEAKDAEGGISVVERNVQVNENFFFFVGLADGEIGHMQASGNLEPVEDDDKFQDGFYTEGKLAYYLKAKIKGKYLITSSLDTDRDKKELFRYIDPDKYYPIYGDSAALNFDATNTQGPLYVLIEWDKSGALWGNYNTGLTETELANYNRTLYGGKLRYQSVSTTKYGDPRTVLLVFGAEIKQLAAHNEFTGTGGSLYYLKHKEIVEGSEKVAIEVRDKITGLAITSLEQKESVDYYIDYDNGRIMFLRPISSITKSDTIISTAILGGNPVYVVVDYEYLSLDYYSKKSYGGKVTQAIGDHIIVGGTYVKEDKEQENYKLKGGDITVKIGQYTRIDAEYADSKANAQDNFLSTDGGITFTDVPTAMGTEGQAWLIKGITRFWDRMDINGYVQKLPLGFNTQDTVTNQGSEKYGAGASLEITDNTTVSVQHDVQKLEGGGNVATIHQIGAEETRTTTAQADYTNEKWNITGEYRHQEAKEPNEDVKSETNYKTDIAAARAIYQLNERIEILLAQQITIKGEKNNQTTAGIITRLINRIRTWVQGTTGTKGNSALIGLESQVTNDKSFYGSYTRNYLREEGPGAILTFGATGNLTAKSRVYARREHRSSLIENSTGDILGYNRQFGNNWGLNIDYEKSEVNNLDNTQTKRYAGSARLNYLIMNKLIGDTKFEVRIDKSQSETCPDKRQYLTANNIEYHLNLDLSLLGRLNYSKTKNEDIDTTEAQFKEYSIGAAYRPVRFDWLNLLAKYTYLDDLSPSSQIDNAAITHEMSNIYAIEGAFDICKYIQLVEKFAKKIGKEKVGIRDFTSTETSLWINRINCHITNKWDIGLEYRILSQEEADDQKAGYLAELSYRVTDFIQVGAGYNFTDFTDDLVSGNDYSAKGPFVRVVGSVCDRNSEERKFVEERKIATWAKRLYEKDLKRPDNEVWQELVETYNMGCRYYNEGKYIEAIQCWQKVAVSGRLIREDALRQVRERIALEERVKDLVDKGNAYYRDGKYKEAIAQWQVAIVEARKGE